MMNCSPIAFVGASMVIISVGMLETTTAMKTIGELVKDKGSWLNKGISVSYMTGGAGGWKDDVTAKVKALEEIKNRGNKQAFSITLQTDKLEGNREKILKFEEKAPGSGTFEWFADGDSRKNALSADDLSVANMVSQLLQDSKPKTPAPIKR